MSHPDTVAVHAGREDLTSQGIHVPQIDLSTTYPIHDMEAGGEAYTVLAGGGRPVEGATLVYRRLWNPTVARFESALAALEGADDAVAFASGMAAVTAALLAGVTDGKPHIVAVRPLYGGTDHLLASGILGTSVTFTTAEGVASSVRPETGLVMIESPANPSLDLVEIAAVAADCGDVPLYVDNTFATPVLQRPLEHGATLVMHSATKYLGGHGDLLGGVIATSPEWAEKLRAVRGITGALLHPLAGYQLHRGLQTLPVRVRTATETASRIAAWLDADSRIGEVRHPSLEQCDPEGIAARQMDGPGAMLAFTPAEGGFEAAAKIASKVRLITHAVSLGGVDSLIEHPASLTHRPVADAHKPSQSLLRLSVGLEAVEDLIADLDRALG